MLQIVVCSTAAMAGGLPLRPDVHNTAERDRSAGSGRARQPMFRPRPSQPCSFCGRWSAAWRERRLSRIHGTEAYPALRYRFGVLFSTPQSDSRWGTHRSKNAANFGTCEQTSDYAWAKQRQGGWRQTARLRTRDWEACANRTAAGGTREQKGPLFLLRARDSIFRPTT